MAGDMRRHLQYVLFAISIAWITLNVFFLPFFVWTAGIVYPWFIIKGLTPYKDVIWLRMPLDIFLLSGWYRVFGATGGAYQLFIWLLLILLSGSILWFSWTDDKRVKLFSFLFFHLFLFPIFINTEVGEVLVGVLSFMVFACMVQYMNRQSLKFLFPAGIIAGLVIVAKQNAVLTAFVPYGIMAWMAVRQTRRLQNAWKHVRIYSAGVLLPLLFLMGYFAFRHALSDFLYYSVYTVIGPYREFQLITHGDGLLIEFAYACLVIAFLIFRKRIGVKIQTAVLLTAMIIALAPSLLPSYLSYRAFTGFPLVSIAAGYLLALLLRKNVALFTRLIIGLSFAIFVGLTWRYTRSYIDFVRDNGFHTGQYLTDYGQIEQDIAEWISRNTTKSDRIMSYGSEMIYILSDRLPVNKYTNFTPFILQPYDFTSNIFIDNPPKVIVFDWSHPDLERGLSAWPFLTYMKKNYREVKRFDALDLYTLKR